MFIHPVLFYYRKEYMEILLCKSQDCKRVADNKVFWPGKTTEMCQTCTIRAIRTANHMGFKLDYIALGLPSVDEIKEKLRTLGK